VRYIISRAVPGPACCPEPWARRMLCRGPGTAHENDETNNELGTARHTRQATDTNELFERRFQTQFCATRNYVAHN